MGKQPLHHAWIIVLSGIFVVFSSLGLGRFALGMLLPSMGANLALTYTEMGIISTGNFIGYLLAVLVCGQLIQRIGERGTIFAGLILVGASMLLVSQNSHYLLISSLYFITGFGSGVANVTAMGLVAHWFGPKYRGRAAGYMVIGCGLGIVISGLLIPWLNANWPETGWRIAWSVFALFILFTAFVTGFFIRNNPKEIGLHPFGATGPSIDTLSDLSSIQPENKARLVAHLGTIYFMFGFTYVIYATFIVTTLVEQYQFTEARAGMFWMAIGILSVFSGPLFGWVSDHFGRKSAMASIFAFQTASYLLTASELGQLSLFASMTLFGLTVFGIPAIIPATISDRLPPGESAKVFGYVTFFFGIGQITGPTLAGYLAEQSGFFSSSYLLAAAMTAFAIGLTLMLKQHNRDQG